MGYGEEIETVVKRKIVFLTGTRADYGKMKPLMRAIEDSASFELYIFVCGMHLSKLHGSTYDEICKDGYKNIHIAYGLRETHDASMNFGNTVSYFSGYIENVEPDMIVVHGDRMDALAGAVVGALHNIIVAHIEGGELSGTIDESIRHAVSKFAHVHFVCTDEAQKRLIQLGEESDRVHVIGSPDIDIMRGDNLPSLESAKKKYEIAFNKYAILLFHPVTTEYSKIGRDVKNVVDAVVESKKNYIVIYPNNDLGSEIILHEYDRLRNNSHFLLFPSIRFEFFLTLLKNSEFMIGNSSAGIREAGIYGIPAIDIGSRQAGRYNTESSANVIHCTENKQEILKAIDKSLDYSYETSLFGLGDSTERFMNTISDERFWETSLQKRFIDYKEKNSTIL